MAKSRTGKKDATPRRGVEVHPYAPDDGGGDRRCPSTACGQDTRPCDLGSVGEETRPRSEAIGNHGAGAKEEGAGKAECSSSGHAEARGKNCVETDAGDPPAGRRDQGTHRPGQEEGLPHLR